MFTIVPSNASQSFKMPLTYQRMNSNMIGNVSASGVINNSTDNSKNFGGFTFNIYTNGVNAEEVGQELGEEIFRRMRMFSTI